MVQRLSEYRLRVDDRPIPQWRPTGNVHRTAQAAVELPRLWPARISVAARRKQRDVVTRVGNDRIVECDAAGNIVDRGNGLARRHRSLILVEDLRGSGGVTLGRLRPAGRAYIDPHARRIRGERSR